MNKPDPKRIADLINQGAEVVLPSSVQAEAARRFSREHVLQTRICAVLKAGPRKRGDLAQQLKESRVLVREALVKLRRAGMVTCSTEGWALTQAA